MNHLHNLHDHLKHDPKTGIIAGLSSGVFLKMQHVLTDEMILKLVAGIGTWCSSLFSVLALTIWVIKRFDRKLSVNNKTQQHEKISERPLEEN